MANDLATVKSYLDKAKTVLIVLPSSPSKDAVAATLALYLSLKAYGKEVTPVASTSPLVRDSRLVGLDKITSSIGGKNLVLTINAPEDAVDKVTSNTEGGHLNLIVIPKNGANSLTKDDISFSYSGSAADLIVTVGASSLADLGAIADKEHELFSSVDIINLGSSTGTFGVVNLTDTNSSNSELVTAMLEELKLPLDLDIAGNLMQGIEDATVGLSSSTMTADTFEALALLYRAGARRTQATTTSPVKVVADIPIVEVESKDVTVSEIKSPRADWSGPKIMQTGLSAK